jgi:hypothetical protein
VSFVMPEFQRAIDSLRRPRRPSVERFEDLSAERSAAITAAKQRREAERHPNPH